MHGERAQTAYKSSRYCNVSGSVFIHVFSTIIMLQHCRSLLQSIYRTELSSENIGGRCIYKVCFKKMTSLVKRFQDACRRVTINIRFSIGDALYLCSHALPASDVFDVIHTSNLIDFVGLLNVLLACKGRLKRYLQTNLSTVLAPYCAKLTPKQYNSQFFYLIQIDDYVSCRLLLTFIHILLKRLITAANNRFSSRKVSSGLNSTMCSRTSLHRISELRRSMLRRYWDSN